MRAGFGPLLLVRVRPSRIAKGWSSLCGMGSRLYQVRVWDRALPWRVWASSWGMAAAVDTVTPVMTIVPVDDRFGPQLRHWRTLAGSASSI